MVVVVLFIAPTFPIYFPLIPKPPTLKHFQIIDTNSATAVILHTHIHTNILHVSRSNNIERRPQNSCLNILLPSPHVHSVKITSNEIIHIHISRIITMPSDSIRCQIFAKKINVSQRVDVKNY